MSFQVQKVSKVYSDSVKIGPVNLYLNPGEIVVFLGANGAGKSTLFKIFSGCIDASDGECRLNGKLINPEQASVKRQSIGYLPQHSELPHWMSPRQLAEFSDAVRRRTTCDDDWKQIFQLWEIEYFKDRPLANCSHGMKKRVGLALATIHQPDLLILDEPFSGLDISQTSSLIDYLQARNQQSKMTILSTHIIPYAADVCHKAVLLETGQMRTLDFWEQASKIDRVEQARKLFESSSITQ